LRTATVGITGTPSVRASASGSSTSPSRSARSDHVERDHHRAAQLDQLLRKHQVLLEVRCVEDDDQHLGLRLAGKLAEHDLAGHFLVGARRVERVAAGQVDQLDRLARRQHHAPGLPLDSDAGVVGNLLTCAVSALNSALLPELGLPTSAAVRRRVTAPRPSSRGRGCGDRHGHCARSSSAIGSRPAKMPR
jgi:hypothetical protein